ncbi:MAG TPA: hypothetical protein VM536_10310, partial [Chloroflexia bacterium]|nr:hypothetical protein [Chloroflexia bacterium]
FLLMALLTVAVLLVNVPPTLQYFSSICDSAPCDWGRIVPEQAAQPSLALYAIAQTSIILAFAAGHFAVAAVIAWRKSDDWMALLVALFLITHGGTFPAAVHATPFDAYIAGIGTGLLGLFLYLFPNGRFVPAWTAVPGGFWVTMHIVGALLGQTPLAPETWPEWLRGGLTVGLIITTVLAQIYRYRRVSSPVQRQQTKWVVYAIAVAGTAFITLALLYAAVILPGMNLSPPAWVAFATIFYLPWMLIPLSIAAAILRSRLYDIELILNRTLVYGSLTVLLVAVYFGSVLLLERVLNPLVGQGRNGVAVVAATLAIAALFNPLRKRLQSAIDRRFYRRKYDAARTLAAFGAALREQTNLDELTTRLEAVVVETVQPEHFSLWVRKPAGTTAQGADARVWQQISQ